MFGHTILQVLIILLSIHPVFSQRCDKTIRIATNEPPSPLLKEGYNLIFFDEFDGTAIDTIRWDRSSWNNEYSDCSNKDYQNDPKNAKVADGKLHLKLTADSCGPCAMTGAEVKTFNSMGKFQNYSFATNCYLEFRVKMAFGANCGCAGWLYYNNLIGNTYREIDLWETRPARNDRFQNDIHFRPGPSAAQWTCFKNLEGKPFDLGKNFVNIGLHLHPTRLKQTVNSQTIREIELKKTNDIFDKAMFLRLSIGYTSLQNLPILRDSLPREMVVDYVRIYVKDGEIGLPIIASTPKTTVGEGFGLRFARNPNAKISVTCPGFRADYYPENFEHFFWIVPDRKLESDRFYFLTIKVDFGTGYHEQWLYPVYLESQKPPEKLYPPVCTSIIQKKIITLRKYFKHEK